MRLSVNDLRVDVRDGTPADVPLLLGFIRQMAAFEKLEVAATEASLHEALFGPEAAGRALLVHVDDRPVGYITYFFTFTSMMGRRALWLDDLYIVPEFRGRGIGKALMAHLAGLALEKRCARFEWIVLDWNAPAIEFYRGLGARMLPDWKICRLEEGQLAALAGARAGEEAR